MYMPIHEDSEHRRTLSGARAVAGRTVREKPFQERRERVADSGRRSAGTGMYMPIHEDSEHRRTLSGARAV